MSRISFISFITLLIIGITTSSQAASKAVILMVRGSAQVLDIKKNLGKTLSYKGEKFYYKKLRLGQRVLPGQFIKCDPKCKVKVGFVNGDSLFVGPGTTMEIPKVSKKEKNVSELNLIYGKIRAIVAPKKEKKELRIMSRAAVSGVRGTDLFVSYNDFTGHHTSVVRGEVEVSLRSTTAEKVKPQSIKSGDVASIKEGSQIIETRKINRAELKDIQSMANIKPDLQQIEELTPESKVEIAQIEKQVSKTIVEDIKKYNPELIEQLSPEKPLSDDELNGMAIAKLLKEAPEGGVEWEPKAEPSKPKEVVTTPHWANKLEMTFVFTNYKSQGLGLEGGSSTGARAAWNPRLFTLGTKWTAEAFIGITPTSGTSFAPDLNPEGSYYEDDDLFVIEYGFRFKYRAPWYFVSFGLINVATDVDFRGVEFQLGLPAKFLPKLDSIAIGISGLNWDAEEDDATQDPILLQEPIKASVITLHSFWRF